MSVKGNSTWSEYGIQRTERFDTECRKGVDLKFDAFDCFQSN